jgi:hypothetical protein
MALEDAALVHHRAARRARCAGFAREHETSHDAYTPSMVSVPVWIESWVHECCGLARRTGETTELLLTFSGDVAAVAEADSIDVLDEGRVKVIGTAVGRTDDCAAALWAVPRLRGGLADRMDRGAGQRPVKIRWHQAGARCV